jgi:glutaminyl-tRNA synthetase
LADINPDSLEVLPGCRFEPAIGEDNGAAAVQFERAGYFCRDPDSTPGHPVFNRTIGLRDSYARVQAQASQRN